MQNFGKGKQNRVLQVAKINTKYQSVIAQKQWRFCLEKSTKLCNCGCGFFPAKLSHCFFTNFSVLRTNFMLQFTRAIANFCEIGVQDDRNQKRHKNLPRQEKEPTQGIGQRQFDLARQRSCFRNW